MDAALSTLHPDLWINGSWTATEETFAVQDPATGETLAEVADASPEQALAALAAATEAAPGWAATPPRERAEVLRRAYELIVADEDRLARCMTLEMGKPLTESRGEVSYGAEFFRWYAEEAVRSTGQYGRSPDGKRTLVTVKKPVGPAYAITPWNFPLAMATRKIAPALAAGCPIILKPAAETPLTSLLLMDILAEAGVPAGVVNCVTTSDAAAQSAALMADPRLRKVTFTGSTEVGRTLLHQAADQVLNVSMELGGNAPFIVLADADLPASIEGAMTAKMRNIGEACISANRFLVHESVAEEFTAGMTEAMGNLKPGHGLEEGSTLGPLIDDEARDRIHGWVHEAVRAGGQLHCGGEIPSGPGHFYPATVLSGISAEMTLAKREIFGPVVAIQTFDDADEAVALANDSEHGLSAYIYGRDGSVLQVAERLESGMVGVNTGLISDPAAPFGGVKQSGLGREGARDGIEAFLETTYLALTW